MPANNLPSGQISFLELANGTCLSTSNITMGGCARRAGVDESDNQMSINEFQNALVVISYEAVNFDENYDYIVSYVDDYCGYIETGVIPGGSFFFNAIRTTVTGNGNGTINVL